MVLEFSFSNFGPVKEKVTLSFEATNDDTLHNYYVSELRDGTKILKLGMVYGPNASGKTTILNALQLLRDLVMKPLDQKTDQIKYKKHLLGKAPKKNTEFNLIFYLNDIKYDYKISFNNSHISKEILNYYPNDVQALFYKREYDGKVSNIKFGGTVEEVNSKDEKRLEANTIKNVTVLGAYLKTNVSVTAIDSIIQWFDRGLLPLISPNDKANLFDWTNRSIENGRIKKENVIQLLKSADLNISDLKFIEDEIDLSDEMLQQIDKMDIPDSAKEEIKKERKIRSLDVQFLHEFKELKSGRTSFPLEKEDESNGTIRYYQLLGPLLLAIKENGFLFIDEIDSSLHPDLFEQLIVNFLENSDNAQLLFTTHNISLLKERDILRNDTIWFTEKSKLGATDLFSLAEFKSDKIRKDSSIFNAYNIGKLGAKPKTSSVKLDKDNG